jgi:hypothetical protein
LPAALHESVEAAVAAPPTETLHVTSLELFDAARATLTLEDNVHRVDVTAVDGTGWHARDARDLHQANFQGLRPLGRTSLRVSVRQAPFDPAGPNYGIATPGPKQKGSGDARIIKLDDLHLQPHRVFGYWFDFGDNWFQQVQVERIKQAIPTVTYPRVIKRVANPCRSTAGIDVMPTTAN